MNIHSLYITRSKDERDYFYKLLEHTKKFGDNYIKIVHIDFKWDSVYKNIKFNNKHMVANVYTNGLLKKESIFNFEDLVKLFEYRDNGKPNAFVYSGHSNGINLMKHNIRILRIEDFCELVYRTLNKKADVLIYDCCLCGNISALNISMNFSKFMIAASSYWSSLSILHTYEIYENGDLIQILINSIKEFIEFEKNEKDAFTTDIMLYELNNNIKILVNLVLKYKDHFKHLKDYIIDKGYYKDLYCVFKDLGIPIQGILDKFILFKRFEVKRCHPKVKSIKANTSWPSELSIILKNPTNESTDGAIFFPLLK